jgi:hypothetical protein
MLHGQPNKQFSSSLCQLPFVCLLSLFDGAPQHQLSCRIAVTLWLLTPPLGVSSAPHRATWQHCVLPCDVLSLFLGWLFCCHNATHTAALCTCTATCVCRKSMALHAQIFAMPTAEFLFCFVLMFTERHGITFADVIQL